jgi:hypothetical protein
MTPNSCRPERNGPRLRLVPQPRAHGKEPAHRAAATQISGLVSASPAVHAGAIQQLFGRITPPPPSSSLALSRSPSSPRARLNPAQETKPKLKPPHLFSFVFFPRKPRAPRPRRSPCRAPSSATAASSSRGRGAAPPTPSPPPSPPPGPAPPPTQPGSPLPPPTLRRPRAPKRTRRRQRRPRPQPERASSPRRRLSPRRAGGGACSSSAPSRRSPEPSAASDTPPTVRSPGPSSRSRLLWRFYFCADSVWGLAWTFARLTCAVCPCLLACSVFAAGARGEDAGVQEEEQPSAARP